MGTRKIEDVTTWKIVPLAASSSVVHASPDPESVFLARPSILALPGGRIIVACDQDGPGVRKLPGTKGRNETTNHFLQGQIMVSTDKGESWSAKHAFPFCNPCLFNVGHRIYLLGHKGNIQIMRSDDGGETWNQPADLTSRDAAGSRYVQGPISVMFSKGHIYVALMQYVGKGSRMSSPGLRSLVVMRADRGVNLAARKSWTFSAPGKPFTELVPYEKLDFFGAPFFEPPESGRSKDLGGGRWAAHPGWGHPQIVHIEDPDHAWHDPSAMHVVTTAELHLSNLAAIVKMTDCESAMRFDLIAGAGHRRVAFLPVPGGNRKFSILYDEESHLYWLASNHVTDSMRRPKKLPRERRGLPSDQCNRIALHFSRNLVDWSMAGLVDAGASDKATRSAPSMAFHGNDLYITCASGDENCKDSHHTNLITFHHVPAFRELVY